ncbi:hypothetical protein L226DRAFT_525847 [Lentinus tigrinus ALCF2SS1-7]|uniref:Uncharacterized protein n=1 Tax=Lentinus tigrinus ALCF2SS1-6 TaxID=1328759 RepID=A0A5C2RQ81_9APHY|nr:hypothetical protein L227DRAFT_567772 [Lentinus tigrinus ALCF2SS1-6]RPD70547.1 hypothetical protein L226DRAFT_525847 [Lentinus tigrinus ALCF2SS1-7]
MYEELDLDEVRNFPPLAAIVTDHIAATARSPSVFDPYYPAVRGPFSQPVDEPVSPPSTDDPVQPPSPDSTEQTESSLSNTTHKQTFARQAQCDWPTLARWRRTTHAFHTVVSSLLRGRYNSLVRPFVGNDPTLLNDALTKHAAIISGSTALQFFMSDPHWEPNDLDIYVADANWLGFIDDITNPSGLNFSLVPPTNPDLPGTSTSPNPASLSSSLVTFAVPPSQTDDDEIRFQEPHDDDQDTPDPADGPAADHPTPADDDHDFPPPRQVQTYYTPTGRRVDVIRSPSNNPITPLRFFWSTHLMNFLTPTACVCAFHSATLLRQGALKNTRLNSRDRAAKAKYEDRLFTFHGEELRTQLDVWDYLFFGELKPLVMDLRMKFSDAKTHLPIRRSIRGWVPNVNTTLRISVYFDISRRGLQAGESVSFRTDLYHYRFTSSFPNTFLSVASSFAIFVTSTSTITLYVGLHDYACPNHSSPPFSAEDSPSASINSDRSLTSASASTKLYRAYLDLGHHDLPSRPLYAHLIYIVPSSRLKNERPLKPDHSCLATYSRLHLFHALPRTPSIVPYSPQASSVATILHIRHVVQHRLAQKQSLAAHSTLPSNLLHSCISKDLPPCSFCVTRGLETPTDSPSSNPFKPSSDVRSSPLKPSLQHILSSTHDHDMDPPTSFHPTSPLTSTPTRSLLPTSITTSSHHATATTTHLDHDHVHATHLPTVPGRTLPSLLTASPLPRVRTSTNTHARWPDIPTTPTAPLFQLPTPSTLTSRFETDPVRTPYDILTRPNNVTCPENQLVSPPPYHRQNQSYSPYSHNALTTRNPYLTSELHASVLLQSQLANERASPTPVSPPAYIPPQTPTGSPSSSQPQSTPVSGMQLPPPHQTHVSTSFQSVRAAGLDFDSYDTSFSSKNTHDVSYTSAFRPNKPIPTISPTPTDILRPLPSTHSSLTLAPNGWYLPSPRDFDTRPTLTNDALPQRTPDITRSDSSSNWIMPLTPSHMSASTTASTSMSLTNYIFSFKPLTHLSNPPLLAYNIDIASQRRARTAAFPNPADPELCTDKSPVTHTVRDLAARTVRPRKTVGVTARVDAPHYATDAVKNGEKPYSYSPSNGVTLKTHFRQLHANPQR